MLQSQIYRKEIQGQGTGKVTQQAGARLCPYFNPFSFFSKPGPLQERRLQN